MEHKIKLVFGYTDKQGETHREVTFGRRLTAGDVMVLDTDPQAQNPTQYADLIRRRMITGFGSLSMPVGLNVLLALNSIDRQDLQAGADKFLETSRGDRESEYRENNVVQLRFGFRIDGTEYRIVELGKLATGRDEVDADAVSQRGVVRECFLLGRQITKISTDDEAASIDGPIDLDHFKDLDAEDLNLLRIGAQLAELSFRFKGEGVSDERPGEGGDSDAAGDGNDGGGDPQPSGASAEKLSRRNKGN